MSASEVAAEVAEEKRERHRLEEQRRRNRIWLAKQGGDPESLPDLRKLPRGAAADVVVVLHSSAKCSVCAAAGLPSAGHMRTNRSCPMHPNHRTWSEPTAQQQPQPQPQPQPSDAEAAASGSSEAASGFVPAPDDLDDLPEAEAAEAAGGDNQRRPPERSVHTDATVELTSNPTPNPNPAPNPTPTPNQVELIFAKLLEKMPHVPPQERKVRPPSARPHLAAASLHPSLHPLLHPLL